MRHVLLGLLKELRDLCDICIKNGYVDYETASEILALAKRIQVAVERASIKASEDIIKRLLILR